MCLCTQHLYPTRIYHDHTYQISHGKPNFFCWKFRLNYFHMHNRLHNCTYATQSHDSHTRTYTHINECTRKVKSHLNLLRLQTFYRPLVYFLYQHLRKDEQKMNMGAQKFCSCILHNNNIVKITAIKSGHRLIEKVNNKTRN